MIIFYIKKEIHQHLIYLKTILKVTSKSEDLEFLD